VIFPVTPIYGFFFRALPIMEPVQDVRTDRTGTLEPDASPWHAIEVIETRWVLKGYEWRPVAVWFPVLRPGQDYFVDDDPVEMNDRAAREEQERAACQRRLSEPAQLSEPARPDPVQQHQPTVLEQMAASLDQPRTGTQGGAA
jgi:hypothetical protein